MYTLMIERESDMQVVEFFDTFMEAAWYADYYALFPDVWGAEVILTETCETCYSNENVFRQARWL
jgi:hypothetical protein